MYERWMRFSLPKHSHSHKLGNLMDRSALAGVIRIAKLSFSQSIIYSVVLDLETVRRILSIQISLISNPLGSLRMAFFDIADVDRDGYSAANGMLQTLDLQSAQS